MTNGLGWATKMEYSFRNKERTKEEEFAQAMADEVWLTEKQLVEEMPFFKKSWVKKKGYKLHPRRVIMKNKEGDEVSRGKRYFPRNAILKKLRESTITDQDLGWSIYNYRLNGGKVEVGGYDLFSKEWQKGLSIDEIVYQRITLIKSKESPSV